MKGQSRPSVLLLSALTALTALSIDMSLPALPLLQGRFHATNSAVQLTLSLFLGGYAVGQLTCGPLSDRYGRRPLLLWGLSIYVLASLGCAFAPSLPWLVSMRLLQGIGGSVGPILARAMVRDCFEKNQSAQVLSQITQVMVLAPLVAPTIGAALLAHFDWHSIFFVLAGSGAAVLLVSWLTLRETRPPLASLDDLPPFWGGLRRVVAAPVTAANALMISFAGAGMFAYISASPFIVIEIYRVPRGHFGYYFALSAFSLMAGATVNRSLVPRVGSPGLLRLGVAMVCSAGGVLLTLVAARVGGLPGIIVPMMGYLFGIGLLMPNATAAAMEPHGQLAGLASSFLGGVQTIGSALAAYLVGLLYNGTPLPLAGTVAAMGLLTLGVMLLRSERAAVPASVGMAERMAVEEEFVE